MPASNFEFLKPHDLRMAELGADAKDLGVFSPDWALIKLRQFAELLLKTVAVRHGLYVEERETLDQMLLRLPCERIIPKEAADQLVALRKAANWSRPNDAPYAEAVSATKLAWELGVCSIALTAMRPTSSPARLCRL